MSGKSSRCASLLFLVVACLCLAPWCAAQTQENSKTQAKLTGETPNKADDKSAAKDGTNQNATTPVVLSVDADNSSSADGKAAEMQPSPSASTGRAAMTGSLANIGKPTSGPNGRAPQLVDSPGRPGTFSIYMMTEYRRDEISFTGKPSTTLQFPFPILGPIVPGGPQFVPEAFEPNDEQFTGYTSATYRDFGFEHLRFDVAASFRYTADLDGATTASPFLTLLNTFTGRRIFEPLTAYADIHGAPVDGRAPSLNVRVGRQYIYGAGTSLIADGATVSYTSPKFEFDAYGGRRVTFYSDADERVVAGENFLYRPTANTTLRFDFLHYIDNSYNLEANHRLGEQWILNGSLFFINTDPVDLNLGAHYVSPSGNTRVNMNLQQKLTSSDFIYDQTYRDFARNVENQILLTLFPLPPTGQPLNGNGRLNLFQINPYTQFYVDAYHYLTQKFGVGGTFWIRKVDDRSDEGPFDNSFQEYHVNADYFPSSRFEVGSEYRFRHFSKENPELAQFFFDISREGTQTAHEVYANAAYHLFNNLLTLEGGLFYRRFNTQSRLISLDGMDTTSFMAGVRWRIGRNYKLLFEYGVDKELEFLYPDIDHTQQFRIRFEWRFSR